MLRRSKLLVWFKASLLCILFLSVAATSAVSLYIKQQVVSERWGSAYNGSRVPLELSRKIYEVPPNVASWYHGAGLAFNVCVLFGVVVVIALKLSSER